MGNDRELALNLWEIFDMDIGEVNTVSGKANSISGDDKQRALKVLTSTEHYTSKNATLLRTGNVP